MLRGLRKLKKNEEGATAIEFAMVAPVLLLLIFGIIELGIMFTTQSALEGAASNAARTYKAEARSNSNGAAIGLIRNLIVSYGGGLLKPGKMRVVAQRLGSWGSSSMPNSANNNTGNSGRTGQIIQYRVYYNYSISTPILKNVFGSNGNLSLRASTVVQNEPAIGGGGGA